MLVWRPQQRFQSNLKFSVTWIEGNYRMMEQQCEESVTQVTNTLQNNKWTGLKQGKLGFALQGNIDVMKIITALCISTSQWAKGRFCAVCSNKKCSRNGRHRGLRQGLSLFLSLNLLYLGQRQEIGTSGRGRKMQPFGT